jgi:hypothetical protein
MVNVLHEDICRRTRIGKRANEHANTHTHIHTNNCHVAVNRIELNILNGELAGKGYDKNATLVN